MAQDDYFVIAYKLLKYLYDCLKQGSPVSREVLCADFFGINDDYWAYIIRNLFLDGYVEGVTLTRLHNRVNYPSLQTHFNITPKGIQYIQENSAFEKIRGYVKDIASLIP